VQKESQLTTSSARASSRVVVLVEHGNVHAWLTQRSAPGSVEDRRRQKSRPYSASGASHASPRTAASAAPEAAPDGGTVTAEALPAEREPARRGEQQPLVSGPRGRNRRAAEGNPPHRDRGPGSARSPTRCLNLCFGFAHAGRTVGGWQDWWVDLLVRSCGASSGCGFASFLSLF
jgi:hypothetical protein